VKTALKIDLTTGNVRKLTDYWKSAVASACVDNYLYIICGRKFGAGNNGGFWRVDTDTGDCAQVYETKNWEYASLMTASEDALYIVDGKSEEKGLYGDGNLYKIDVYNNGTLTNLGKFPTNHERLDMLCYSHGKLFCLEGGKFFTFVNGKWHHYNTIHPSQTFIKDMVSWRPNVMIGGNEGVYVICGGVAYYIAQGDNPTTADLVVPAGTEAAQIPIPWLSAKL